MNTERDRLKSILDKIIDETFAQTPGDFTGEIDAINRKLNLQGDNAFQYVRNKYFTVDITQLSGDYMLILSLNNKYIPGDKGLDRLSDRNNYEEDVVRYFERDKLYKFFTRFKPILQSFADDNTSDARCLLRKHSFFIEHLPYWSAKTPSIDNSNINWDDWLGAHLSKRLFQSIMEIMPPKAIVLNGTNTHGIVDSHPLLPQIDFTARNLMSKKIQVGEFNGIKVVKCNFINSVYGPNSNDEKRALGKILRES